MRPPLAHLVTALACVASLAAGPPAPRGLVNDFANVLDETAEAALEAQLRRVHGEGRAALVVVTEPSLEGATIEQRAAAVFAAWGIGRGDVDNGILILVAPSERETRIEVGYGLEAVVTDARAGDIVRGVMVPHFERGRYADGLRLAVDRLNSLLAGQPPVPLAEDDSVPSPWLLVPFLGLFVAGGALALGAAVRARTWALALWGALFGLVPLTMLLVSYPFAAIAALGPVACAAALIGYRKAGRDDWRRALRGKATGHDDWVSGGSSDGSSSSDSSSSAFDGGSSGGGGASGRW